MKKNRGKLIFIVACVLLSIYFLYPTYKDYTLGKEISSLRGEDSLKFIEERGGEIREARAKRIKLGLDLQGGMRVVLEVDALKLLTDLAQNKDDAFNNTIAEVKAEAANSDQDLMEIFGQKFQEKEMRLGRYYRFSGDFRSTDDDILARLRDEATSAVDRAMEIVRNRVDQYGVSEPSISKQGSRRIVVELPGVTKEAEVRDLIGKTALLEFKLLIDPEITSKVYDSIDKTLAGKPLTDTSATDTTLAANTQADSLKSSDTALTALPEEQLLEEEKQKKEHPFFYIARPNQAENQAWTGELLSAEEDREKVNRIVERPDIKRLIPSDMSFAWSAKPASVFEGKRYYALYAVKRNPELTGGVITEARANVDPSYNTPIVTMEMNSEGARDWGRITGANINKRIAIVLDNAVYSAPVVRGKIPGGSSQIEGMENMDEAKNLAIVLKSGALPAPVDIVQQTSVGASLGDDSISKGLWSVLVAFGITILFMILYYSTAGTVADAALVLNLLFVLAVLAAFQGTLTLPGIAGIILSIAVAVDANVLIYERIREEALGGKTWLSSLDSGYSKAFTAIFDSNLTTFITGVILYNFGSGPIQGFALTLMIGIAASMFSSIVITRVVFELMFERGKSLSFG